MSATQLPCPLWQEPLLQAVMETGSHSLLQNLSTDSASASKNAGQNPPDDVAGNRDQEQLWYIPSSLTFLIQNGDDEVLCC
jgi:hypothetical protein